MGDSMYLTEEEQELFLDICDSGFTEDELNSNGWFTEDELNKWKIIKIKRERKRKYILMFLKEMKELVKEAINESIREVVNESIDEYDDEFNDEIKDESVDELSMDKSVNVCLESIHVVVFVDDFEKACIDDNACLSGVNIRSDNVHYSIKRVARLVNKREMFRPRIKMGSKYSSVRRVFKPGIAKSNDGNIRRLFKPGITVVHRAHLYQPNDVGEVDEDRPPYRPRQRQV